MQTRCYRVLREVCCQRAVSKRHRDGGAAEKILVAPLFFAAKRSVNIAHVDAKGTLLAVWAVRI
jgi:hypothetical protein